MRPTSTIQHVDPHATCVLISALSSCTEAIATGSVKAVEDAPAHWDVISDPYLFLNTVEADNPILSVLLDASSAQKRECGCGISTFLSLCGSFARASSAALAAGETIPWYWKYAA